MARNTNIQNENTSAPIKRFANRSQIALLGIYFVFTGILLLQNAYNFWPETKEIAQDHSLSLEINARQLKNLTEELKTKDSLGDTLQPQLKQAILNLDSIRYYLLTHQGSGLAPTRQVKVSVLFWDCGSFPVDNDHALLLLVLIMGAIGSWLHAASSFLDFVGNRNFITSWITWYLMRPILGAMMAVIFYVVIRAGLFPHSGIGIEAINPFSIAALAGLVGLFTQRATKKLADVFDALFPTQKKDEDPLAPKPQSVLISQLSPDKVSVGTDNLIIQVTGNNFTEKTMAFVNSKIRSTSYISKESLSFSLLPEDVKTAGELTITVYDPDGEAPNGGINLLVEVAPTT